MINGKVKCWFSERGFGFIARDDGQGDAFIHIRQLERSGISGLEVGERVEFELAARGDKFEAVGLRRRPDSGSDRDGNTIGAAPEWVVKAPRYAG